MGSSTSCCEKRACSRSFIANRSACTRSCRFCRSLREVGFSGDFSLTDTNLFFSTSNLNLGDVESLRYLYSVSYSLGASKNTRFITFSGILRFGDEPSSSTRYFEFADVTTTVGLRS